MPTKKPSTISIALLLLVLTATTLLSGCQAAAQPGAATQPAVETTIAGAPQAGEQPAALPQEQSPPPGEQPAAPSQEPSAPPGEPLSASTAAAVPAITSQPTANPYPNLLDIELPVSDIAYLLPLTIRHITQTQAVLFFELSQPAAGTLLYQEKLADGVGVTQAVPLAAGETRHQVVLDGLKPGAEYLALVALQDEQRNFSQPAFLDGAWGSVRLRTLSGQAPLRVGVFGDASFGDPSTEALMQRIAALELDFVIETGDVVAEIHENKDPVEAYALKFYRTLAPLLHQAPVYTVMGNHDYDAAARWQDSYYYYHAFPPFPDPLFPERQVADKNQFYAVAAGDIQFIFLDTQAIFGMGGREQQDAWMAERLADARFRYTIPVFHVPPFFSGAVHPDDQLPIRQSWQHLFNAARVPLVLSGHSHHYERLVADGITYLVSGGGSGITYAAGEILPQSQVYARKTHFVLLEIYPDRIEITAVDKDGEVIDQAVVGLE